MSDVFVKIEILGKSEVGQDCYTTAVSSTPGLAMSDVQSILSMTLKALEEADSLDETLGELYG